MKLLVIACNTATAAGLVLAQRAFSVPVIGVIEPGARAAVMATRNRRVGVIGTVGTIESGAYSRSGACARRRRDGLLGGDSALRRHRRRGAATRRRRGGGPARRQADVFVRPSFHEIARDYLDPLKRSGIDTLVLGCTHYPLLSAAIQQVVGSASS